MQAWRSCVKAKVRGDAAVRKLAIDALEISGLRKESAPLHALQELRL